MPSTVEIVYGSEKKNVFYVINVFVRFFAISLLSHIEKGDFT